MIKALSRRTLWFLIIIVWFIGGGSMLLFGAFLFTGGFQFVDFGYGPAGVFGVDIFLCFLFFIQHSVMVRPFFRTMLNKIISVEYHGAVYSIASGVVLVILVVFWQKTEHHLYAFPSYARPFFHGIFFLTALPCYLCFRALDSFDALGLKPMLHQLGRTKMPSHKTAFSITGPYRYVRHPIYLCCITAMWVCPVVSTDRFLFNVLWTAWIITGARLEESDLAVYFGEAYRNYQRRVPMLIPRSFKPRI